MTATQIVDAMMERDYYSQWLGVFRMEEREGYCKLSMTVRKEMLNGFGIAHGAITFGLADSCFAFASNSRGREAVSIETSISHVASVREGDVLTAESSEDSLGNRIAVYSIKVRNQRDEVVALFKGTVYRKSKEWTL